MALTLISKDRCLAFHISRLVQRRYQDDSEAWKTERCGAGHMAGLELGNQELERVPPD